ncbi:hypothetical protein HCUR_00467 [Holospora curviuscula]|uniref:Uncharacterized protein n=1 Tax=Holospora curviuscula TaxID=1082868 RepID=A0A2S5RAB7_9PROT|nr:hypothetical protein HCUR_00467 [Holospora curviuscula]
MFLVCRCEWVSQRIAQLSVLESAPKRIKGLNLEHFLAKKTYDSDDIVSQLAKNGMIFVISARKNPEFRKITKKTSINDVFD